MIIACFHGLIGWYEYLLVYRPVMAIKHLYLYLDLVAVPLTPFVYGKRMKGEGRELCM